MQVNRKAYRVLHNSVNTLSFLFRVTWTFPQPNKNSSINLGALLPNKKNIEPSIIEEQDEVALMGIVYEVVSISFLSCESFVEGLSFLGNIRMLAMI